MRVLITGGLGFMGSNFTSLLLHETDWNIWIVDGISYATNLLTIAHLQAIAEPRQRNLEISPYRIHEFLETYQEPIFDIVIHFAALSHVDRSWLYPSESIDNNVKETERLLSRVNYSYFVHISTDEVYGPSYTGIPFREATPFAPTSPYSMTKAIADYLVQLRMMTDKKTRYLIVRPTNCYGYFQCPEKLIPFSITNLLLGKKIKLYGDGSQKRTWFWIEDFCRILLELVKKGAVGIFNMGPPPGDVYELTNREIVRLILDCFDSNFNDHVEFIKDRPRHDARYVIDTYQLYEFCDSGLECMTPREGIKKTINWYRNHVEWWQISRKKLREWYSTWYGENL